MKFETKELGSPVVSKNSSIYETSRVFEKASLEMKSSYSSARALNGALPTEKASPLSPAQFLHNS